jgi:hypothetical protein
MITKSMSRKTTSFRQLLKYLEKDDLGETFSWNMYSNRNNHEEMIREFMENAQQIKNSRGSIYLYHEVISLEADNLTQQQANEILYDLSNKYIESRAENHLAFGAVHHDTNNPHIHLVISANEAGNNKRFRLTQKEFQQIKADLENYKNKQYEKELGKSSRYQAQSKQKDKAKQSEQEMKHKRQKTPNKEKVADDLIQMFKTASSKKAFENAMNSRGYETYTRGGKTVGVKHNGKKYRFSTLGVTKEFQQFTRTNEAKQQREAKRSSFKESKTKQQEPNRSR